MSIGRSQLFRLTAGKAVANTALRWIPFFLPTLTVAFAASTEQLTAILGFGEMAGLCTLLAGRTLDGGRERWIMSGSLVVVGCSAMLALVGTLSAFAVSFVALIVGVSLYTVGGHTYMSRRVPFDRRARAIGTFETSWALALLVGAPLVALLITGFGWRGPFVAIAVAALAMAAVVATTTDVVDPTPDALGTVPRRPLTARTWRLIFASAAIAMAGLTTIVIAGTWLDDRLGVSTGGIGLVAMAFGVTELTSSVSSAAFADRIGKVTSARAALFLVLIGAAVMTQADASLLIGVAGLLCFFLGFEYAIVTSFSIVSEAMPEARGRALATSSAIGTVARGTGTVASGALYARFGIAGPVTVTITAALVAILLLSLDHRFADDGPIPVAPSPGNLAT